MKIKLLLLVGICGITQFLQGSQLQKPVDADIVIISPRPCKGLAYSNVHPMFAELVRSTRNIDCVTPDCGPDRSGTGTPKAVRRSSSSRLYGSNSELSGLMAGGSSPRDPRDCPVSPYNQRRD